MLDVGGGSTELVTPDRKVSLDVGSVRLTERFLPSDPPTRAELEACAEHVRAQLPELAVDDAVGVAGTITSLAALDLGLDAYDRERVDGHVLTHRTASSASSNGSPHCRSPSAATCPRSSRSARR